MHDLSPDEIERYDRHIRLADVGEAGQVRLRASSVLVIGAGGLGSSALFYLAAAGVGRLGIAEGDVLALSNLQRQILHTTLDLARTKVDSAAEKLEALNPNVEIVRHGCFVDAGTIGDLIARYDLVVDATDSFGAKFLINDACVLANKPYIHAGVVGYAGQIMTVFPRESACLRCLFERPPAPDSIDNAAKIGVLGPLAGMIGNIEAIESFKIFAGVGEPLTNTLLTVDALTWKLRKVHIGRWAGCPVCSDTPTMTKLDPEAYLI